MRTSGISERAIWDPVETASRDELRELQLERLRSTVERVVEGQPPGAARLGEAGVTSHEDVATLDDLAHLPFSFKADLREHYPFGLLACRAKGLRASTPRAGRTARRPSSATRAPTSIPGPS